MSLWKVKFDHVNGEIRKCKGCGEEYHAKKPRWLCKKCVAKKIFDDAKAKYSDTGLIPTGKWAGMKPKEKYPFDNRSSEASNRFCTIRTSLSKAWKEYQKTGDRSIITKHYDNQLNEIRENGILEWILDRRADGDKKNMEVKSKTKTNKEYPNTRDMPYDI
jgi:hypothetical protein